MGAAFAAVVTAFTGMLTGLIGKHRRHSRTSTAYAPGGRARRRLCLTAVIVVPDHRRGRLLLRGACPTPRPRTSYFPARGDRHPAPTSPLLDGDPRPALRPAAATSEVRLTAVRPNGPPEPTDRAVRALSRGAAGLCRGAAAPRRGDQPSPGPGGVLAARRGRRWSAPVRRRRRPRRGGGGAATPAPARERGARCRRRRSRAGLPRDGLRLRGRRRGRGLGLAGRRGLARSRVLVSASVS